MIKTILHLQTYVNVTAELHFPAQLSSVKHFKKFNSSCKPVIIKDRHLSNQNTIRSSL